MFFEKNDFRWVAANFVSWKAQILLVLRENELWEEVVRNTTANPIVILAATDAVAYSAFNKKDIKAMRIILDAVKDHVIPHISVKDHAPEMWRCFDRVISEF